MGAPQWSDLSTGSVVSLFVLGSQMAFKYQTDDPQALHIGVFDRKRNLLDTPGGRVRLECPEGR